MKLGYPAFGSFDIPILVPHPIREDQEIRELRDQNYEPFERRAVRTFGDALHALDTAVLLPGAEPGRDELDTLVEHGLSHELCQSLFNILKSPDVDAFELVIDWAPTVRVPASAPRRIVVPRERADLVKVTGDLLRSSPIDQGRVLSGPVIGLERLDESGPGEVKILAMHNSRERDVTVVLPSYLYQQAVDCHRDNRTVIVEGDVEQHPPGRFRIPNPLRFEPLDQGIGPAPPTP